MGEGKGCAMAVGRWTPLKIRKIVILTKLQNFAYNLYLYFVFPVARYDSHFRIQDSPCDSKRRRVLTVNRVGY